jgi:hypothetical protein
VQFFRFAILGCLLLVSNAAAAQTEPTDAPTDVEAGETTTPAAVETAPTESAPESGSEGGIRDTSIHEDRPFALSGMLYIPWYYGIGIGAMARFEIPVVKDGFIPSINDQFSIEPSIGFGYRSRGYGFASDRLKFFDITPAVYALWSFHITPKFRPYGAIGLGYDIGIWLNDDDYPLNDVTGGFFYWDIAVGLFYKFTDNFGMRADLGVQGPKFGLAGFF